MAITLSRIKTRFSLELTVLDKPNIPIGIENNS